MSVDLIGSTAFKNRIGAADEYAGGHPWIGEFARFYASFSNFLVRGANPLLKQEGAEPILFKAIGDELVFSALVKSGEHIALLMEAFRDALCAYYRQHLVGTRLGLKGTAWLAGFPINNAEVRLPNGAVDFIGPSIDAGFRVAKFSSLSMIALSVDLALVLALVRPNRFEFVFHALESMKGVLGGNPYPIFGLDSGLRTAEEELTGEGPTNVRSEKVSAYATRFFAELAPSWLFAPYLSDDERFKAKPAHHDEILALWEREEAKTQVGLDGAEASLGSVDTGAADARLLAEAIRIKAQPAQRND
ncbi:MAG: hypothetical protein QM778_03430 [Myxococcales bacterium]